MLIQNSSYEFVTISDDTFDMILPYNFRICMESIKDKNEDRPESSFQPGTLQILKCQLRTYLLFCVNFDTTPFPVDSETISTYARFLLEEFKSSDSIRNYISGIKAWATLFKHNVDNFYSPSVTLTLTGLDKLNIRISNQRLPLLVSHLFQLYECID